MKETIVDIFHNFTAIIIFFHVISAVIWVGGMLIIKIAVHNAMQNIQDTKLKLEISLKYIKNLLNFVKYFIGILIVTAVFMTIGFGFKGTPLSIIAHAKETIWLIMTIIFIIIWIKRDKAQNFFDNGNLNEVKKTLAPISLYLIPTNIILGIIAIYLGITLRGF